jgi:hypothetical protein
MNTGRLVMTQSEIGRSYSFAAGIFSRERIFHLGPEALHWENGRDQGGLAYADVDSVHIFYLYRAWGFSTQMCLLRARSGARCVLKSKSFRTWGRSDDRSSAYFPFVRDLLGRVSSAAPQARFFDGLPRAWYFGQAAALAFFGLLIVADLAPMIGIPWKESGVTTGLIIVVVLLIPAAIGLSKTLLRGWPHVLDPRHLPDQLNGLRLAPQPQA